MMKAEELKLTREWDKTFPKGERVDHCKVTFANHFGITLAADMYVPRGAAGKAGILAGTVSILERALEGCAGITEVEIPDSVTTIGRRAFKGCTGLKAVKLPKNLKAIADNLFLECASLESVEVPDSVIKIGCGAFEDCPSLEEIRLPRHLKSIGYNAFDQDVKIIRERRSPEGHQYPAAFQHRKIFLCAVEPYEVGKRGDAHDPS